MSSTWDKYYDGNSSHWGNRRFTPQRFRDISSSELDKYIVKDYDGVCRIESCVCGNLSFTTPYATKCTKNSIAKTRDRLASSGRHNRSFGLKKD